MGALFGAKNIRKAMQGFAKHNPVLRNIKPFLPFKPEPQKITVNSMPAIQRREEPAIASKPEARSLVKPEKIPIGEKKALNISRATPHGGPKVVPAAGAPVVEIIAANPRRKSFLITNFSAVIVSLTTETGLQVASLAANGGAIGYNKADGCGLAMYGVSTGAAVTIHVLEVLGAEA